MENGEVGRGVLLPGAPDLSSFNENLSAFQYNQKPNFFAECVRIALASASVYTEFMKKFLVILVLCYRIFSNLKVTGLNQAKQLSI